MRISDWSSDVCSSDLESRHRLPSVLPGTSFLPATDCPTPARCRDAASAWRLSEPSRGLSDAQMSVADRRPSRRRTCLCTCPTMRSEEHTSELQSLMRISYAVFCLKNKNKKS